MVNTPELDPPIEAAEPLPFQNHQPRRLGILNGKFKIPDDFDTMCQEEIIALFEGRIP